MGAMRISEVATQSGIPSTTLRYYEDIGLLAPERAANGYRMFDADVLERLRFITAAKHLHLPLDEIRSLLTVWQTDPCASVKAQLRPLVQTQLADIGTKISELTELQTTLRSAAQHLDELPDRADRCQPECAFLTVPPPPPPVACSLGAGQPERIDAWHDAMSGAPRRTVTDGVEITLPVATLSEVSALAVAEQECCPFFSFTIGLHGPTFTLTITAPPEGHDMLDQLFPGATDTATNRPAR